MAEACCPASCGELIQGWVRGGEHLVSCPIDWFSTVEVREGSPLERERPRMRAMLGAVLRHLHLPAALGDGLRIEVDSTIPVGKGMASSTADIAATAQATARHLGHELSESDLAALCVGLEPTDSTLFRELTLFDHKAGAVLARHDWLPEVELLILESPERLLTSDYHRRDRRAPLLEGAPLLARAWHHMELAARHADARELGQATTLSAIASQRLLVKPLFSELLALVEQEALLGLNVAHSGTVVGLLLDPARHDRERIAALLSRPPFCQHYPRLHRARMVAGGVR